MLCERSIPGMLVQWDRPNWEPLIHFVGTELVGVFMWMCEIELADQSKVHGYKHVSTRRYIHLAEDGRVFTYTADARYREIHPRQAIVQAFAGWEHLLPQPSDPTAVRAALHRAYAEAAAQTLKVSPA